MLLSRLGIATCLAGAVTFGQQPAPESDLAVVTVVVSDTFGRPIPGAQITLAAVGPSEKFTAIGGETTLEPIPFGRYDLQVRLAGFEPRSERIRIYQPIAVFHIGLEAGAIHSDKRPELAGTISPDTKGRSDLWVRLVALYSGDLVENTVDRSGHFELGGMALGKYLLFLFQKDKVVATKTLDVLGGKQAVELTLEPH